MNSFEIIFFPFYIINVILLFYYGIHTYVMVYLCNKYKGKTELQSIELDEYPHVTIQLPIFNEKYVVERVIRAAIEIDYPKEKKEIQVLDDSTDDCLDISKQLVREYKKKGYDIVLMHRTKRTGHKGGALREALNAVKGDYIAIFDADFVPHKMFLKATVPYFKDKNVGMVQTRWGHVNADYSLLTRAQSIGIDGHFIVDQIARGGSEKLFMNFNGTAGIWSKACILDAGNWQDDTLTEDFDLSYRAMLKGWKFKYVKDVVNDQELPVQISAYKSQQFRWAKGSIQTAIKLTKKIVSARQPLSTKIEAITHLTYYTIHPLMIINILLTIPVLYLYPKVASLSQNNIHFIIAGIFFAIATLGPLFFYSYSQFFLYKDWKKKIFWVPFMMIFGVGIAVNNTKAFLEAIVGKKSAFIRTPKHGIQKTSDTWQNKKYKSPVSFISIIEFLMGCLTAFGIYLAIQTKNYLAIPFLSIYMIGFYYVFIMEMIQTIAQLKSQKMAFQVSGYVPENNNKLK